MPPNSNNSADPVAEGQERRSFLTVFSSVLMALGLTGSYGTLAALAGRYLFPTQAAAKPRMFVSTLASIPSGESLLFVTPDGLKITITRLRGTGKVDDFIALSSVCPHLGCQVNWEPQNGRFFCPCHNGAFDPSGLPIAGPPKDAGQSLSRYPLSVEDGMLFIEMPADGSV